MRDMHGDERRLGGRSKPINELLGQVEKVARTDIAVLILGESGAGKEMVARLIHRKSGRGAGPFVTVNCGAIPADLAESQLFGHEKGSFTGAVARHTGYFERAHNGTLFLDEITEMPLATQVKLLRALETRTIYRVGGSEPIALNVRALAATHRHPVEAVQEGTLREDLLYRLAAFALHVPPLRQRADDIEAIAQEWLDQLNVRHHTQKRFSPRAIRALHSYRWPGNVRELQNVVTRAYILADQDIEITLPSPAPASPEVRHDTLRLPLGAPLIESQNHLIEATLRHFDGDKPRAAQALGISLKTLYNRLGAATQRRRLAQLPPGKRIAHR